MGVSTPYAAGVVQIGILTTKEGQDFAMPVPLFGKTIYPLGVVSEMSEITGF
jgi:hypothetical protein